jgi:protein-S-isoprenylcysteine O-methyltransferase Ste14
MLMWSGTPFDHLLLYTFQDRVTSFPFNVTNNPMYDGSTLCFLSTALW